MVKALTAKEEKLLAELRKDREYSREESIEIWYDVRQGLRKKFPIFGYGVYRKGFWQFSNHRIYITQEFIDVFRSDVFGKLTDESIMSKSSAKKYIKHLYPERRDFPKYKLWGLIDYYSGSPCTLFLEAGCADKNSKHFDSLVKESPWLVFNRMSTNYWDEEENQRKATEWLIKKTKKGINEIVDTDFQNNRLEGLIQKHDNSPARLFRALGYDFKDTDRKPVPTNGKSFWTPEKAREWVTKDIDRLIEAGTVLEDITKRDLSNRTQNFIYDHNYYDSLEELKAKYREWTGIPSPVINSI